MFVSSARLSLRSSTDEHPNDRSEKKSDGSSVWSEDAGEDYENTDNPSPYYPSVAQRIAVWKSITSETSGLPSEVDMIGDHAPSNGVNTTTGRETTTVPAAVGNGKPSESSEYNIVDLLKAELESSRQRNKKLSVKLASVERQIQHLQINQRLQNDQLDAIVAVRVADALNALVIDSHSMQTNGANVEYSPMDDVSFVSQTKNSQDRDARLLTNGCDAMLTFIRQSGCQLPSTEIDEIQGDLRHSIVKPLTRDAGTDAFENYENTDDSREKEQLRAELDNVRRSLENSLSETNRLRVELENLKNKRDDESDAKNAECDRLRGDLERLRNRYEQAEAKWEQNAYELRVKYQTADEENFRLTEELRAVRREQDEYRHKNESENDTKNVNERLGVLDEENRQLNAKNEELKRLVIVLRRKLSAANANAGPPK